MEREPGQRDRDRALGISFVLLLLFATPFTRLWAAAGAPWYLPYLLWAAVLLLPPLLRLAGRRERKGE